MCGRFTLIDIDEIRKRFNADPIDLKNASHSSKRS